MPAICVCARHAKGVLSTRVNKSDPHDAEGLAQLARTGWYKAVHIKDSATHLDRAQLAVREQLIKAHRAMLGQLRGLLKLFGLRLGKITTPGKRADRLRRCSSRRWHPKGISPQHPVTGFAKTLITQKNWRARSDSNARPSDS